MKLLDTIFFSLAVVFTVIGIHSTIATNDLVSNYGFFMLSSLFFLLYLVRKKKRSNGDN